MDLFQSSQYYRSNFTRWFEVGKYKFLFKKITEADKSDLFIAQTEEEKDDYEITRLFIDCIYNSVIDWKNVKVSDLEPDCDPEYSDFEVEGFSKEGFDLFLKNNMHLLDELYECIDAIQKEFESYQEKRFKKMIEDIEKVEEARVYEEVSKHVRKRAEISYESARSLSIFNRCYDGMSGIIKWEYVLFWCKELGVKDVETECEIMILIRTENSKQDDKKEQRKKDIKAKSEEMDMLISRKFSKGSRD